MAMPSTKPAQKKPAVRDGGKPAMAFAHQGSWLLKNLSDPIRMQILLVLTEGKKSRREICERVGLSEPAFNHHLVLLRSAKVLVAHFDGDDTSYKLTEPGARLVNSTLSLIDKGERSAKEVLGLSRWKKLVKKVGTVVDDPEYWLNMPNPQFEWRRPIDLVGTDRKSVV